MCSTQIDHFKGYDVIYWYVDGVKQCVTIQGSANNVLSIKDAMREYENTCRYANNCCRILQQRLKELKTANPGVSNGY